MARPLIVLGTPCFGSVVGQAYTLSVLEITRAACAGAFDLEVVLLGGDALISRARSTIAARFLDTPDATHLLFVDADISFALEQLLRLLAFDRDFAAAFYPLKQVEWGAIPARVVAGETLEAAGLSYVGSLCEGDALRTENGFATARFAGSGFQLIKRAVFERMIAGYPHLKFSAVDTPAGHVPQSAHLYALFDPLIDAETGRYRSEDYAFCQRWRDLGGEIWLDLESRLTHTGLQQFAGDTSRRFAALRGSAQS